MNEFLLLNEVSPGDDPIDRPQDVRVYSSSAAAEKDLKSWYANESHVLLGQDGKRRMLDVQSGKVRIIVSPDQGNYSEKVREFLVYYLSSVEKAIHKKKNIGGTMGIDFNVLPTETLFRLAILFNC